MTPMVAENIPTAPDDVATRDVNLAAAAFAMAELSWGRVSRLRAPVRPKSRVPPEISPYLPVKAQVGLCSTRQRIAIIKRRVVVES